MKITDTIFRYPSSSIFRNDGLCRVRTFVGKNKDIYVLITDIGDKNPSASVTNSIEYIYDALIERGIIPLQSQIIEHYENSLSFDLVSFTGSPNWKSLRLETVLDLLNCDEIELNQKTSSNPRLISEIEKLRYDINPLLDFPYREDPEVVKRRLEIESKSISKDCIAKIIEDGAKEQDILKLLKQDLSLFGEVYSNPSEEYICFSEFPVLNGRVDFAVFTGRSRMNIFLIEVKGANFNLVNRGSYGNFSSKVEEAAGQLRNRLGYIYRNYEEFRKEAHKIRETVESGQMIHNALIGPQGVLQVDPNKDINIYPVLIAGRTVDDLSESKKRQDYENNTNPSLKVETWDTWIRKLRR